MDIVNLYIDYMLVRNLLDIYHYHTDSFWEILFENVKSNKIYYKILS